jgi:hypothetical protein
MLAARGGAGRNTPGARRSAPHARGGRRAPPVWSDARLMTSDATLPPGHQTAALATPHGRGRPRAVIYWQTRRPSAPGLRPRPKHVGPLVAQRLDRVQPRGTLSRAEPDEGDAREEGAQRRCSAVGRSPSRPGCEWRTRRRPRPRGGWRPRNRLVISAWAWGVVSAEVAATAITPEMYFWRPPWIWVAKVLWGTMTVSSKSCPPGTGPCGRGRRRPGRARRGSSRPPRPGSRPLRRACRRPSGRGGRRWWRRRVRLQQAAALRHRACASATASAHPALRSRVLAARASPRLHPGPGGPEPETTAAPAERRSSTRTGRSRSC